VTKVKEGCTTLGKLFTHTCIHHETVLSSTNQRAVIPRNWKSNHNWSDVTWPSATNLVVHHRMGSSLNLLAIALSIGKWQISTSQGDKTPELILMKLDYVRDPTPHDNFRGWSGQIYDFSHLWVFFFFLFSTYRLSAFGKRSATHLYNVPMVPFHATLTSWPSDLKIISPATLATDNLRTKSELLDLFQCEQRLASCCPSTFVQH